MLDTGSSVSIALPLSSLLMHFSLSPWSSRFLDWSCVSSRERMTEKESCLSKLIKYIRVCLAFVDRLHRNEIEIVSR